jgi:5-formyltetrahydrofolate cyclo-ligase
LKKAIREEVLKRRDGIPPDVKKRKDALVKQRLFTLPEFINAKAVSFYASFRSEVETLSMIKESLEMGKRVVLPKVDKERRRLNLYEIKDINELSSGYMGIPEPSLPNERLVNLNNIDLFIIPGVGFDYSGNRLGYGAGYYDKLLSEIINPQPLTPKPFLTALAYEEQLIDSIPSEMHDVKVDMIITDKRAIRCHSLT